MKKILIQLAKPKYEHSIVIQMLTIALAKLEVMKGK